MLLQTFPEAPGVGHIAADPVANLHCPGCRPWLGGRGPLPEREGLGWLPSHCRHVVSAALVEDAVVEHPIAGPVSGARLPDRFRESLGDRCDRFLGSEGV